MKGEERRLQNDTRVVVTGAGGFIGGLFALLGNQGEQVGTRIATHF